ncbi:hypothetical protein NQ176_g3677 [Zarea fungicola]|uniref:Uncharacterized protein n=1 Tax=Zarea fungicola TaxID=93591 RepID=A0ACC1NIE5_9HYPO|nr:hypothetical protein NQ176_g3677 [Lecanicillium fungicola]
MYQRYACTKRRVFDAEKAVFTNIVTMCSLRIQERCDPDKRDKAPQYIVVNIALGTSTTIVALSRLFFKRFIGVVRKFGPDDWVVLATLIVGTPCAFINRFGLVHSGIGKDARALGPDTVSDFAFYFDMMEVLYAAALALVRMTFIAFYFTIFTIADSRTWTRPLLWLAIVFDALLGIISVCMAARQCLPISFYWTRYNNSSATGHCIPIEPMAWANGVLSIAFDLMIILIPLVEVSKMMMSWKKKLSIIVMFLVGTFATVVSILRLVSVTGFSETVNITWNFFGVGLWSTVEINVGIICSSLPTVRLILVQLSPRVFGTRRSHPGTTLNSSADSEYSRRFSKGRRLSLYPDLEQQNELEEPKDSDIDNSTNEKSTNFGKTGGVRLNCSTLEEDDAERL